MTVMAPAIWTSKAAQYWILAIVASMSTLSFLVFQSFDTASIRLQDLQFDAPSSQRFQAFELEGISIALPFPELPKNTKYADQLPWLLDNFETRIRPLSDGTQLPDCDLDMRRFSTIVKTSFNSRSSHPISIAINLHNSQHVLPSQMRALLTAIHHLLPAHAIFLSIFENDSKDTTSEMLGQFAAALERLGIDGLWITSSKMKSGITVENRIDMLAEIRNAAIRPLLPYAGSGTIVFVNDVILCASDVLEMILQLQIQSADAVVGVDWADSSSEGPSPPYVYDAWVLRGINGQMVYPQSKTTPWPLPPPAGQDWLTHAFSTQDTDLHERWLNNLPFPAYAGWGGIVALKAELFVEHGLRFRSSKATGWDGGSVSGSMGRWGKLVTDAEYMKGDCPGDSECGLIMRDIWNLRQGKARIVLASQVCTAYSMHVWKAARLYLPFIPRNDKVYADELIDWSKASIPKEVMCMPGRTESGKPHDAHDTELFRYLSLNPYYEPKPTSSLAWIR